MVLVDTSVWVDHLRAKDETLVRLLVVAESVGCLHEHYDIPSPQPSP